MNDQKIEKISLIVAVLSLIATVLKVEMTIDEIPLWFLYSISIVAFLISGVYIGKRYFPREKVVIEEVCPIKNEYGIKLVETADRNLGMINDGSKESFDKLYKGWFSQLQRELHGGGEFVFDIDYNYYENCLRELDINDVYTVADLTNSVEQWDKNKNLSSLRVKERIFLISKDDVFDPLRLHEYFEMFTLNKSEYDIRIAIIPDRNFTIDKFDKKIGFDLFIGKQPLVGGYIQKGARVMLRMVRDKSSWDDAQRLYTQIKDSSVEFNLEWDTNDLKKALIDKKKIGYWSDRWPERVQARSQDYFNDYNYHIQCWIPYYRYFIEECFEIIKQKALQMLRNTDHELKIFEIGFGTGALTNFILSWIHEFEIPTAGTSHIHYIGMDPAKDDMLRNNHKLSKEDKQHFLFAGMAFDKKHMNVQVLKNTPYDIICLSLVLHDIIKNEKDFIDTLKNFSNLLTDNGIVVIADVFSTKDPVENNRRFGFYEKFLMTNLSEPATKKFIDKNPEMFKSIAEETVMSLCDSNGFHAEFKKLEIADPQSPFEYLILQKIPVKKPDESLEMEIAMS